MPTARWKDATIAESSETIEVEGNQYFPPAAVDMAKLRPSSTQTTCPWKGVASYYDVEVDGKVNKDAAWQYKDPKPKARELGITDHIAFWNGVDVDA